MTRISLIFKYSNIYKVKHKEKSTIHVVKIKQIIFRHYAEFIWVAQSEYVLHNV